MSTDLVIVENWAVQKGYANGRIGRGPALHIAGQVGWNAQSVFEAQDLVSQFAQALSNVIAVLHAAHGKVTDIAEMTVYVTDIEAYRAVRKELGPIWRERRIWCKGKPRGEPGKRSKGDVRDNTEQSSC